MNQSLCLGLLFATLSRMLIILSGPQACLSLDNPRGPTDPDTSLHHQFLNPVCAHLCRCNVSCLIRHVCLPILSENTCCPSVLPNADVDIRQLLASVPAVWTSVKHQNLLCAGLQDNQESQSLRLCEHALALQISFDTAIQPNSAGTS